MISIKKIDRFKAIEISFNQKNLNYNNSIKNFDQFSMLLGFEIVYIVYLMCYPIHQINLHIIIFEQDRAGVFRLLGVVSYGTNRL